MENELQIIKSYVFYEHDLYLTFVQSMSGFSAQVRIGVFIKICYLLTRKSSHDFWTAIPYPASDGRFTRFFDCFELRKDIEAGRIVWFRPRALSESREAEESCVIRHVSDMVDDESLLVIIFKVK